MKRVALAVPAIGLALLSAAAAGTAYSRGEAGAPQAPTGLESVLEPGSCYRLVLPVQAAAQYKVLELLDGGWWIRAEVDAGTASAKREPLWINSAQIVAVRRARCSD